MIDLHDLEDEVDVPVPAVDNVEGKSPPRQLFKKLVKASGLIRDAATKQPLDVETPVNDGKLALSTDAQSHPKVRIHMSLHPRNPSLASTNNRRSNAGLSGRR